MRAAGFFLASASLAWALVALPARADIPPQDTSGCTGKKAGDACETDDKKSGTCAKDSCSRATPDGSVAYECYKCVAGGAPTGSSGGGSKSGGCAVGHVQDAGICAAGILLGVLLVRRRR